MEYGNLYSVFGLPIEYRKHSILSDLNIEYNILEFDGNKLIFSSSPMFTFYIHEDDEVILISENINSILA